MGIVFCCLTFPPSARTEKAMGWAGLSGIGNCQPPSEYIVD